MKIKKVLDIFKEHGFDENNCSFFRQEDINDIAKDVIAAINYTHCCTELVCERCESTKETEIICMDCLEELR
tara:strand:+ start:47 stop:262 length:216 start_codon:yes stop_codon:yes gene_type:complete